MSDDSNHDNNNHDNNENVDDNVHDDDSYLRAVPDAEALAWVTKQAGASVVGARFLTGGISHSNFALTLATPEPREVVLRRWLRPGWQQDDPDFTVEREIAALTLLERHGIAAPRLLAADIEGRRCTAPALLMTRLPGHQPDPETAATSEFTEQLAAAVLALHQIPAPWPGIPAYRPYNDLAAPTPPTHTQRPDIWERAFAVVSAGPPPAPDVFIHRDFHPGNTLWRDGVLTGIVDWTTASYGAARMDLGHMRWNLVLDHGEEAADQFATHYRQLSGGAFSDDPHWDLRTVIDLLPDDGDDGLEPDDLARLEPYLERLLSLL